MVITSKKGFIVARAARWGRNENSISRINNRGESVSLPRDFSNAEVKVVQAWAKKLTAMPTWDQWQKFLRTI